MTLRPFQQRFVRAALDSRTDTAVLSLPRGNGKSWLAAHLVARAMTPGDLLFQRGGEPLLVASSLDQARIVYRFARAALGDDGYRYLDSGTRLAITHPSTATRLRVLSSDAKRAMGIVGCPLLIADEPGAWVGAGGELMHDAIQTAQGKPGSPLRVVYIGTLAPAAPGHWWPRLVGEGSTGSTYVQVLQGDIEKWDRWPEIRRCNPLTAVSPEFRAKLREERDKARRDSRLRARFLSYRLNVPTADEATVLLTVADWRRVTARPVPAPEGRPVVGVDLGAGRAWSAAVAVWRSGRCEAVALAPGEPNIADQERRDHVPRGTYARLVETRRLSVAAGVRVPAPAGLVERVMAWRPAAIVCDRFRLSELQDAAGGRVRIVPRVARWSDAAKDIRALRRAAADGPLAVERSSRPLIAASLAAALVANDDQGNTRLAKRGTNNTARDDVAAAMVLAAGAWSRRAVPRRARIHVA
ncbi:MAG: hypothetical protein OXH69_19390 [Acidobacteria bacterium]|nr:hypothetical protein [Acidobacteriota bacterium]